MLTATYQPCIRRHWPDIERYLKPINTSTTYSSKPFFVLRLGVPRSWHRHRMMLKLHSCWLHRRQAKRMASVPRHRHPRLHHLREGPHRDRQVRVLGMAENARRVFASMRLSLVVVVPWYYGTTSTSRPPSTSRSSSATSRQRSPLRWHQVLPSPPPKKQKLTSPRHTQEGTQ